MKSDKKRVYVTGMGAVTSLGIGVADLWNGAALGKSAVRPISFEGGEPQFVKTAAGLCDVSAAKAKELMAASNADIFSEIAVIAAKEALGQAGWPDGEPLGTSTAVVIGTGIGALNTIDRELHKHFLKTGRADPFTIPKIMPSAAASHVSMAFGAAGPSFCLSSACSSSSQAIGMALLLIRSGMADRALVGGTEAFLTYSGFRAWEALRVMTPDLCRPFSKGRNGMVLGEGAAVLLIESEPSLVSRGGTPIVELAGFGTSSDAGDMLRPDAVSCARAMQNALSDARILPHDIGYINAHGTGTILNDRTETAAMREVFGSNLENIAVSSTKPIHGHTLGAAGAIELVVTIEALRNQIAPPTINWLEADPMCVPSPVPNKAVQKFIAAAMSNSFAFGGINSSLIVRRI